jgi:hypothetical protein
VLIYSILGYNIVNFSIVLARVGDSLVRYVTELNRCRPLLYLKHPRTACIDYASLVRERLSPQLASDTDLLPQPDETN